MRDRLSLGKHAGFIQREAALLLLFALAAIPLFLFTRKAAAWNHQSHVAAAAYWFAKGQQQLTANQIPAAIESFHSAAVNDHDNRTYGMALASALAAVGRDAEARTALLRWREGSPEDPEINLQLARLATKDNPAEAARYYHYAIFGVWADNIPPERRINLRFELAEWLLKRHQRAAAISELIALKAELPDTPQNAIRVAQLFLAGGDAARALPDFERALDHDSDDPVALAGAGQASFDLGHYEQARRYLDPSSPLHEVAELVLSSDPLAIHLNEEERRARTIAGLDRALERLESCPAVGSSNELGDQIRDRLASLRKRSATQPTTAQAGTGLEMIARAELAAAKSCGAPTKLDEALLLAARSHRMAE